MKKFWIFLLGIIVAVIGFHFFANKSEPTPDNPPINNEQPGDDNQTPNPSDPDDLIGVPQYTTNTFSIDNIASFQLFKLAEDNVTLNSVDTTNGLDQTQLEVGAIYNLHLDVAYGYEIVEVVYNSNCLLSAPIESSAQVTFTAVENGVFSVTTQSIQTETNGYVANNLVECNAADYTFIFTDVYGNQVDILYAGQDYNFDISINEPDTIIVGLKSNFASPSCPHTQSAGFTFNMRDVDPNSPSIWVFTAFTTNTVNFSVVEDANVSVTIQNLEGNTPESYYAGGEYMAIITPGANYNVLGYTINGNSTTLETPVYGGESICLYFTIPVECAGTDVQFNLETEYVGVE